MHFNAVAARIVARLMAEAVKLEIGPKLAVHSR
jgi:hypothetical protein